MQIIPLPKHHSTAHALTQEANPRARGVSVKIPVFVTREGEVIAPNLFPTSLPKQFIAGEGEAPAEPLQPWLGRSLALP